MVLGTELAVAVGLFVSLILGFNKDKIKAFEPCKTNCAQKEYAVPTYRIGRPHVYVSRHEK